MKRAAFLDRDGVINRKAPEGQYITRWEEMEFLPGVAQAISLLNRAGYQVIVVSNQRCVAKGLLTDQMLESLHQRMRSELGAQKAKIDGGYYCPHDFEPPCKCRKPEPGMLLTAAHEHDIDLKHSWIIGDSDSDVVAGRRAGCKTVRLTDANGIKSGAADLFANSLMDAVSQILRLESSEVRGACQVENARNVTK
jgi:D-glycero-D-manno-heptose 1,7-bisphosphate phosphatase